MSRFVPSSCVNGYILWCNKEAMFLWSDRSPKEMKCSIRAGAFICYVCVVIAWRCCGNGPRLRQVGDPSASAAPSILRALLDRVSGTPLSSLNWQCTRPYMSAGGYAQAAFAFLRSARFDLNWHTAVPVLFPLSYTNLKFEIFLRRELSTHAQRLLPSQVYGADSSQLQRTARERDT